MSDEKKTKPDQVRKLPKQSRSIALLEALKSACLKILEEEGHKALTSNRLCVVAGVSKGSIYQYVPNIEALLALIYEDKILEFLAARTRKTQTQIKTKSLDDLTFEIIDDTIYFLAELYELEPNFFCAFPSYFEFDEWYDKLFNTEHAMDGLIVALFDKLDQSYTERDKNLRVKLFSNTVNTAIRTVVTTEPELIKKPEYSELICDLALAIIKSPIEQEKPKQ